MVGGDWEMNDVKNGTMTDPICGKALEPHPAGNLSAEYKKRRYYFCSERCRRAFHQRTEKFRINELARAGALLTPGKVRWGMS